MKKRNFGTVAFLILFSSFLIVSCANGTGKIEDIKLTDEFIESFNGAQLENIFTYCEPFTDGLAYVSFPEENTIKKMGLINRSGQLIYVFEDSGEWDWKEISDGIATIYKNNKYGYVTEEREITPCIYEKVRGFSNGMGRVKRDGKWGYINKSGEEIIPCIYNGVGSFSDGLALVAKDGLYGYINTEGEVVIPFIYRCARRFSEGLALVADDSYKYDFINTKGEIVVPFEYRNCLVYDYTNNEFLYPNKSFGMGNNKQAILNNKGELVVPFVYDVIDEFSEGLAKVVQNGMVGYLNTKGELVIPCVYDEGYRFFEDLALVVKDGVPMFINKKGKVILSKEISKYDVLNEYYRPEFCNGLAKVIYNGKMGFINKKGEEVVPCIYEIIDCRWDISRYNSVRNGPFEDYFPEGIACAKRDGKWGYINTKGEEITPFEYEEASYFSEGVAAVKKDGIRGYVDKKGNNTFKGRNYEKLLDRKKEEEKKKQAVEENFKKSLPDLKELYCSLAMVENEYTDKVDLEKLGFSKKVNTEYLPEFDYSITETVYLLEVDSDHYCKIEDKPGYESVNRKLSIVGYPDLMEKYKEVARALKSSPDFEKYGVNPWMEINQNEIVWGDGI